MTQHTLDFGRFSIRAAQRQLVVDGQPVALGGRAFDLLLALVERRDRLVSKGELIDLVWPGLVVEENNLQVQVSTLRRLLGTQVITTVQGRGYRFTAEPVVGAAAGAAADAPGGTAGTAGRVMPTPMTASGRAGPATAPAPLSAIATVATREAAAPEAAALARAAARRRLLVAEDNKVNRLLLCRAIELLGHEVAAVENGRAALEALRREHFDLLLLDLEMPEMDGFALMEQLQRDPNLHDLPVIVTSSKEGVADVARCIELGADDYLRKPVNAVLLKARVGTSLEKRRLREQQKALIRQLGSALAPQELPAADALPEAARVEGVVLAARLGELGSGGVAGTGNATAAMGVGVSAEDAIELLDNCHTLVLDAVVEQGGVAIEAAGEGLVAVFVQAFAGQARAVDARLAAARAALAMVEMLEVFDAERRTSGRPGVGLAVGIASGEVLLGQVGAPRRVRRIGLGAPVRRAAQLAARALASGRGILVDEATQVGLAGRVATEAVVADAGGSPAEAVPAHRVRTG